MKIILKNKKVVCTDSDDYERPKSKDIDYIETENLFVYLNEEGKKNWDEGKKCTWVDCSVVMHKKILEVEF